ncbi:TPA: hypothetical protein N0F65_009557 [Lagenidium giganteum]|uniref:DDE-1 domain-containing protein n=1 Tax=Lagenidium giganteum TaxID=4803 RepID=A0AAV2YS83_9STRA|nr:TPA: hypothetical protein N0F65_009557 [Lagenidium giganteum]
MSAHFPQAVLNHAATLNVLIKKIPPNFTWYCQPADLAWIKPLKDGLRRQWVAFLRLRLAVEEATERLYPTEDIVVRWVVSEWNLLSSSTIRAGFAATKLIPREPCENVHESALEHETTHVVLAMEKLGLTDPQMPAIAMNTTSTRWNATMMMMKRAIVMNEANRVY